jgi:4-hydroxy-tetrahydrodipicolinate synthase
MTTVEALRAKLTGQLIPAVPVPFDDNGEIARESQRAYVRYLSSQSIGGVAVWAHTGRGLHLTERQRESVLTDWRSIRDKVVVAGAGGSMTAASDEDYIRSATRMADHAKALGADAILCYAPARFRDRDSSDRDRLILRYHESLAAVGLPLILFYLYEEAGGINYSHSLLGELFKLEMVAGIKLATLDSVMTYQDVARQMVGNSQLLITGEDRFLGYSLMLGAKTALIGMGAIHANRQKALIDQFHGGRFEEFHQESRAVDRFAQSLFRAPMEGYIKRVLHGLATIGAIDPGHANDPFGPSLSDQDLHEVTLAVQEYGR